MNRTEDDMPERDAAQTEAAAGTVEAMDAAEAPPLNVVGHVDAFRRHGVFGWAWCPESPETRLALELRRGEEVVAVCVADQFRQDLADNGVGDGGHAFDCPLPPELADVPAAELSVVVADSGAALPRSDLHVSSAVLGDVTERLTLLEGLAGALATQGSNVSRTAEVAAQQAQAARHDAARLADGLAALTAGLDEVRDRQVADIRRKLDENDAFLMRFDRILADLPDREAWERAMRRAGWSGLPLTLLLCTLSAVIAAVVTHSLMK
ncbi:MAG TPA: hypothetical protein VGE72_26875 [Azospirillum sp.]